MVSYTGRHVSRLSGFAPWVPTPFGEDGNVDSVVLAEFCDRQVRAGATALVVCGVFGEALSLHLHEQALIIHVAAEVTSGSIPVIAGVISNSTAEILRASRSAESAGADAILAMLPPAIGRTQAEIFTYFLSILNSVELPIIVHDGPPLVTGGLSNDTVARLAENPRFIGLNDATGVSMRSAQLRALVGTNFRLFSGHDTTAMDFIIHGGNGCLSVAANVAPGLCRSMYLAYRFGQLRRCQRLASDMRRLTAILCRKPNLASVKFALSQMSLMSTRMRSSSDQLCHEFEAECFAILSEFRERYSDYMP